ncbi:MAG: heavy-metal-associated domain-containing protein, partial [Paramuribaculum sp.]|nr:heavy-metal-associated domain-containing protein [Paramuribaculum sp.]
ATSLADQLVTVTYDPEKTSPEKLAEALKKIGYTATVSDKTAKKSCEKSGGCHKKDSQSGCCKKSAGECSKKNSKSACSKEKSNCGDKKTECKKDNSNSNCCNKK